MSGMKIIRIGCIKNILQYFQGLKYSASQEISLILSNQKNTCFDFKISINKYVEGAKFLNGFKVILGMIICFIRIILKIKFNNSNFDEYNFFLKNEQNFNNYLLLAT